MTHPECKRCQAECITELAFCQAISWERCNKRRLCCFAIFSPSVGAFTVFPGKVLWEFAVSITRKRKALKKQG